MNSISDFFAMGGYAFYVWGSYGITALFMVIEIILVIRHKRTLMQRLGRMIGMNQQVNK